MVSASTRMRNEPSNLVALDRYDGVFFRVLRRALRDSGRRDIDVLVLSPVLGLIKGDEPLKLHEPLPGEWGTLCLDPRKANEAKARNLEFLRCFLKRRRYSEVYVNVGQQYMRLIEGFEKQFKCKIIRCKGEGPGPKAAHMKAWILGTNTPKSASSVP